MVATGATFIVLELAQWSAGRHAKEKPAYVISNQGEANSITQIGSESIGKAKKKE